MFFDIEILQVEKAKPFASDLLYDAFAQGGISEVIDEFERIEFDSINYNTGSREWNDLTRKLNNEMRFEDILAFWQHVLSEERNLTGYYFVARAYDSLGQKSEAINTLKSVMETDTTNTKFLADYLETLTD